MSKPIDADRMGIIEWEVKNNHANRLAGVTYGEVGWLLDEIERLVQPRASKYSDEHNDE